MNINYKKLLPASLRAGRWGELIEAYQSIIENDLKPDLINAIKNQYYFEGMTTAEKLKFISMLGYNLYQYEGYTSSTTYLNKQIPTLVRRILYKTTRTAYKYLFYLYNGIGDVYPTIYNDEYYDPVIDWWTNNENPNAIQNLDAGDDAEFEDTTLDDLVNFTTLDQEGFVSNLVRFILMSFKPLQVESVTEFLSTYSLKGFIKDSYQIKKITERLIYEPYLVLQSNANGTENQITFTNYEYVDTAYQNTILLSGSTLLSGEGLPSGSSFIYDDIGTLRFGIGGHDYLSGISDVETYSFQLTSGQFQEITSTSETSVIIRKKITSLVYGNKFSEVAVLDELSGCMFYSKFPMVNFPSEKIYGNLKLEFTFE